MAGSLELVIFTSKIKLTLCRFSVSKNSVVLYVMKMVLWCKCILIIGINKLNRRVYVCALLRIRTFLCSKEL